MTPEPRQADLAAVEPEIAPLSDAWAAERFAARYALEFRVVHPGRRWLVWTGTRWAPADTGEPERAAIETARSMLVEAGDPGLSRERAAALARFGIRCQSAGSVRAILTLAESQRELVLRADDLDRNPFLLATPSGTVDLTTGKLREADRGDLLTKETAVPFVADATCPRWEAVLGRLLPSPEMRAFLQRAAGYSLTGDTGEQVLFFLHGPPATGKSTVVDTLRGAWGAYGGTAPHDLLLTSRGEQHPTGIASLAGRRLVSAVELEKDRSFAAALINWLTGGDRLTARRMREDFWEFRATHKLWIGANHRPRVSAGNDDGIWRRLKVLPFTVKIPEPEWEANLPDRLVAAEGPGILRWAVEGCLAWRRDGLGVPPEVRAATAEYQLEEDRLGGFLAECCVLDPQVRVTRAALREAYDKWARAAGETPLSAKRLAQELRERGITERRSGMWWWLGIGLGQQDGQLDT